MLAEGVKLVGNARHSLGAERIRFKQISMVLVAPLALVL